MAIVSDIVILARTQMNDNRVCVGGYSFVENRYVRLLVRENIAQPSSFGRHRAMLNSQNNHLKNMNETEPYHIGEIYTVEYENREDIVLPHCEDIVVLRSKYKCKNFEKFYSLNIETPVGIISVDLVEGVKQSKIMLELIQKYGFAKVNKWLKTKNFNGYIIENSFLNFLSGISVHDIHIKNLFSGLLQWQNESGFLIEQEILPNSSVMVVSLNHDLYLSKRNSNYYYYIDNGLRETFKVKYVGVYDKSHIRKISAGTFLRFSLARWWDGNGQFSEKRAYLQLSAIY